MLSLSFGDTAVVVLEPGNLERLKAGDPGALPFVRAFGNGVPSHFVIAYTPDIEWLAEQIFARQTMSYEDLYKLLAEGMLRPVVNRSDTPPHPPLIRNVMNGTAQA